jgi:REP element-mobilizing transposase RayT
MPEKNTLEKTRRAYYSLGYRITFATDMRKSVISRDTARLIENVARGQIEGCGGTLHSLGHGKDYIEFFVDIPIGCDIPMLVRRLKTTTARAVHADNNICAQTGLDAKTSLWAPSYMVETVGTVSSETTKEFLSQQRSADTLKRRGRPKKKRTEKGA